MIIRRVPPALCISMNFLIGRHRIETHEKSVDSRRLSERLGDQYCCSLIPEQVLTGSTFDVFARGEVAECAMRVDGVVVVEPGRQ